MIKKLMLGLGTIATTIPVATIVSCGDNKIVPKDDATLEITQDPQTETPPTILGQPEASSTPLDDGGAEDSEAVFWGVEMDGATHTLTIDTKGIPAAYHFILQTLEDLIDLMTWDNVKLITSIVIKVPSTADIILPITTELSGLENDVLVELPSDKWFNIATDYEEEHDEWEMRAVTRARTIIAIILKALEPGGALEQHTDLIYS